MVDEFGIESENLYWTAQDKKLMQDLVELLQIFKECTEEGSTRTGRPTIHLRVEHAYAICFDLRSSLDDRNRKLQTLTGKCVLHFNI